MVPLVNLSPSVPIAMNFVTDPNESYFSLDLSLLYEAIEDGTVPLPTYFDMGRSSFVNALKLGRMRYGADYYNN